MDLAGEYEQARIASEKATEVSTLNYTKKRSIVGEVRLYRDQKEEIARWEEMKEKKENLVVEHMLWRLYHILQEIETCETNIEEAETRADDMKVVQAYEEKKLKKAKEDYAKANLAVKKQEGLVKAADKALEERVGAISPFT